MFFTQLCVPALLLFTTGHGEWRTQSIPSQQVSGINQDGTTSRQPRSDQGDDHQCRGGKHHGHWIAWSNIIEKSRDELREPQARSNSHQDSQRDEAHRLRAHEAHDA